MIFNFYKYFKAVHFCSDSISSARNFTIDTYLIIIFQTKYDHNGHHISCKKRAINLKIHSEAARCYMGYLIYIYTPKYNSSWCMVGFWHWHIPTFIITDNSPPWWDFVMVGICWVTIVIITIITIISWVALERSVERANHACEHDKFGRQQIEILEVSAWYLYLFWWVNMSLLDHQ